MNPYSHLEGLFIRLRKEYQTFNKALMLYPNTNNRHHITCSRLIMGKLLELIRNEITRLKEYNSKQREYEFQISRKNSYNSNLSQYYATLRQSLNTLTYNIPFYTNNPLSTNNHKSFKLPPKDLINFTNRISRQLSYPVDLQQNASLIPAAFLDVYPRDDQELINSILKSDLSNENRLLRPIVEPPSGQVRQGEQLKVTYKDSNEKEIYNIYFKYTIDSNSIPSFCTGELYSELHPIILERDCIVKVCACKVGRKDSEICTYKYNVISTKSDRNIEIVNTRQVNKNVVERPEMEIAKNGIKFEGIQVNSEDIKSPFNDSGNASYHMSSYIKPQYSPREDDYI